MIAAEPRVSERWVHDTTAVPVYYPHTATVSDAPSAECFTVTGGKITRSVLVFDRPSFAPLQP